MQNTVYGDSYGGLAQNELALDAARDSRYFQALAASRAAQDHADNLGFQQQQLAQARAQAQANFGETLNHGRTEDAFAQQKLAQQHGEFEQGLQNALDVEKVRISPYANKMDIRAQLQLHNEAYNAIQRGDVKTPTELDAFVGGNLPDADKQRLHQVLESNHNRLLHAFSNQQQMADNLTGEWQRQVGSYQPGYDAAQKQIDAAPGQADLHWYNHLPGLGVTTKEQFATMPPIGARVYNQAEDKFQQQIAKSKGLGNIVIQDMATHKFLPVMPRPEDWATNSATPPPPGASSVPVMPVAPTAGGSAAATTAPDSSGMDFGKPVSEDGYVQFPGSNIEIDPAEAQSILAQANAVPSTDPNRQATQHVLMQHLAHNAIARGKARVAAPSPVAPPPLAPTPDYVSPYGGTNRVSWPLGIKY